jgi:hypothetical protein
MGAVGPNPGEDTMQVADAQREMRTVYLGGFAGQLVSGTLWLSSAAVGTWGTPRRGMALLVVGGFFIYPLTVLVLKALGQRTPLSAANPLRGLAMQIAFTVPLGVPLVLAAALHRAEWFYPAFMIVVGAHYLPFIFLYGMPVFAALGGLLAGGGLLLGLYAPHAFALGGWLAGATMLVFAVLSRALAARG